MTDSPEEQQDELSLAVAAWRKAQVLYYSVSWKGRPAARHFAEVLSFRPDLEGKLIELLKAENQLVVAYSLLTLELMNSSALGTLPDDLLERKAKVTIREGSFSDQMELGAFARHVKKRWRTKQSERK